MEKQSSVTALILLQNKMIADGFVFYHVFDGFSKPERSGGNEGYRKCGREKRGYCRRHDRHSRNHLHLCSTTFLMVSANIPATEMIFIFGDCRFNGMESVKITSSKAEFSILSYASPESTACVATARTDLAPILLNMSAALQMVPAVSIMSSKSRQSRCFVFPYSKGLFNCQKVFQPFFRFLPV